MKKISSLIIVSILSLVALAQSPEMMSYQAVVRDAGDNLVATATIGMQISILQDSINGTAVYVETHAPTTNINGLVSLEIGAGSNVAGTFNAIDWSSGPYFIKTETDPTGGTSYTITGTSQLLSVPYALFAKNSSGWQTIDDTTHTLNQVGIGTASSYPGVELVLSDDVFASQVIETSGTTTDAEIWLKNPKGVWRMHGDQSDGNKLKFGLWTDYSEAGGSNILSESLTIDTLGRVGVGSGVNFKEAFNVYSPSSAFINVEASGNNKAGIIMSELSGSRGGRIIVDGTNTNNLIFQVTDDQGQSSGQVANYIDVMHMPFFPGSQVGNVGIGTPNPGVKLDVIGDMRISAGNALRLGGVSSNNNAQYTMHVPNFPGAPTRVSMPFDAGTNRHFEVGYYTNNDENDTWNETLDVNPAKQKVTITDVMNIKPRSTAPANPSKGDIYMDDSSDKLMVYDGSIWQACW